MPLKIIKKDGRVILTHVKLVKKPTFEDKANLDGYCRTQLAKGLNVYVAWYLMTSYLYYQGAISVISDGLYDEICKTLLANLRKVTHEHRRFLQADALKAGTGYHISADKYPQRVRGAATSLARMHQPEIILLKDRA